MPRRNTLSRRTLLGGAGTLLALPWLDDRQATPLSS